MIEPMHQHPGAGVVTDRLLGDRLVLRQRLRGHRAGTDAVLLAAACSAFPGEFLVDVGCGVGTVGLAVALREPELAGCLVDNDPLVCDLARENSRLNAVETRMVVATADLYDAAARRLAGLQEEAADIVATNPPFLDPAEHRASAEPAKARAHVLAGNRESHGGWLRAAVSLLRPKGRFYAIHRPEALPALLSACEGRLGGVALVPVYAKRSGPAIRLLVSGVKGSRAPMRIAAPFVLHEADGRFTPEAEAVHRGEARISI